MAELEKKYSDFQETECKDQEQIEIVEEKICPPCQLNPDFKLKNDWFEISEAYLNEKSCEYHVRVYETEAEAEQEELSSTLDRAILQVAALKILTEFDMPITDGTKLQVINAASVIDDYYNTGSSALGVAYLVAVPAFNLEQIEPDNPVQDQDEPERDSPNETPLEIVVAYQGLYRKYNFIRLTINTYKHYYALAQHSSDSFCIRQEDDIVKRINYKAASQKMKKFLDALNTALDEGGYPKVGDPGLFKSKRAKNIKFVFKEGSTSFEFEELYVLSENCPDSYEKIAVSTDSVLRDADSAVVYNFLNNLEAAHNDIVSKETKPWLDWTLEYFYPQYIVDRGNIEDLEVARVGLECLLEDQLGIGAGNVVDSLSREVLSAFSSFELEYNKQACRELDRLGESNTSGVQDPDPSAVQERRDKMLRRYEQEFINKAFNQAVDLVNEALENKRGYRQESATTENVLDLISQGAADLYWNGIVFIEYNYKNPETGARDTRSFTADIQDNGQMIDTAKAYAGQKFVDLDGGGIFSTDRVQNSPFFYEAQEAVLETFKEGNEFVDELSDAVNGLAEFDVIDLIPVIGLCGLSKLSGKALNCLTNGISFDKFLDIIIEKTFEYMKVNTLDLYYNNLPYSFREELESVIEREFGSDVDLSALFGIKMTEDGDQKLKEFIRNKQVASRIKELFEKYEQPWIQGTDQERDYIVTNLGENEDDYTSIVNVIKNAGFDRATKTYPNEKIDRIPLTVKGYYYATGTPGTSKSATKKFKPSKYVLKYIKYVIRGRKIRGKSFVDATRRISSALGRDVDESIESVQEFFGDLSQEIKDQIESSVIAEIMREIEALEAEREVAQVALDLRQAELADEKLRQLEAEYIRELQALQGEMASANVDTESPEDYIVRSSFIPPSAGGGSSEQRIEFLQNEVARLTALVDSYPDNSAFFVLSQKSKDIGYSLALAIDHYRKDPDVVAAQTISTLLSQSEIGEIIDQVRNKAYQVAAEAEALARKVASGEAEEQLQEFGDQLAQQVVDEIVQKSKEASVSFFNDLYSFFTDPAAAISQTLNKYLPESLTNFEKASKEFKETALGVKVDIVFDLVFDYVVDAILEEFSTDELFKQIKSYPAVDFGLDAIEALLTPNCPNAPLIYPPPGDFLKSLTVDVCDPLVSLTLPAINIPSIDWRFQITNQFSEIFVEAMLRLASKIVIKLATKLLTTLESALCNTVESAGGFLADTLSGNLDSNSFLDALNEAFCNDGENPETSRKRAEELAEALFSPTLLQSNVDPAGGSQKAIDIIGSVSTTEEILSSLVPDEDTNNDQFNTRVANAISVLAPEMQALLGSPDQVAYFFNNLGSHLSPNDRRRIRDLLAADIPNLPVSSAICLTNEELEEWNDLRNSFLQNQGLTPEEAQQRVDDLNNKIEEKAEDIADDIAGLDSGDLLSDALANEMAKALDPCNAGSPLNPSSLDSASQAAEDQLVEGFYNNIQTQLTKDFSGNNSILGEALKDFDGRGNFSRSFLQLFNPNVQNSQTERDTVRGEKSTLGGLIMDALTDSDQVISQYPKTVGITQRDKILDDSGKVYNQDYNSSNVTYRFYDSEEDSDLSYTQDVSAKNNTANMKSFDYTMVLSEKLNDQPEVVELTSKVPVTLSDAEEEYLESIGFQRNTNNEQNLRSTIFNELLSSRVPLNKDYSSLYGMAFEEFNKKAVEMLLTDPREDGIPIGYKFGYVSESLSQDSFTYYNPGDGFTPYNLEESEKKLGKFGSTRIVPLDPSIYGGRYSNPPYFVEPRQFFGWMEIATKAFDSPEGCEPRTQPLLHFSDIKEKSKNLSRSLSEDPRLSKDPECITEKPFHLLIDSKTKSKLDGVVRTTIRTYIVEYFLKGYGLFSNLELSSSNFDQGLFLYIVNKMKSEMYDLGTSFSFRDSITIVKEKYWYTFLEQCVEAYQRMIDIDGITPPENVERALNSIQRGLDRYNPINKTIRTEMRRRLKESKKIRRPNQDFNPINIVSNTVEMGLQSIVFRLTTDEEEKRNFFDGGTYEDYTDFDLRFATLKKLRFHQKIYFIALYEKESIIVMSELIRSELNRLSEIMIDGLSDRPFYMNLSKSIFSTMPESSTRIGFGQYYLEKQTLGESDPGDIPEISDNNLEPRIPASTSPQFIVEKYARLINREMPGLPPIIRNRDQKYVGAISLENLREFVNINLDLLEENNLSDFFGDLSFTYKATISSLFRKGFTSGEAISRLFELNREDGVDIAMLQNARNKFLSSQSFDNFEVTYDEYFLIEGDNPEPTGTIGSTGVKYGIRLSLMLPEGFFSTEELSLLRQNPDFVNLSRNEKSFLFDNDAFMVPLISEEIDVMDTKFTNFDPISGTERYDLECLINKMVEKPAFKLIMEKIFNLKQCSSMLSIYCMETMMPSLGRKVAPESDDPAIGNDSENYERSFGKQTNPEDEWDGTINKSGKNFLRREFKSMYLSRSVDGLTIHNDDDDSGPLLGGLFSFGNPFDFSIPSVRLPWWLRRKMKTKVYDANGVECADPKKDLQ